MNVKILLRRVTRHVSRASALSIEIKTIANLSIPGAALRAADGYRHRNLPACDAVFGNALNSSISTRAACLDAFETATCR